MKRIVFMISGAVALAVTVVVLGWKGYLPLGMPVDGDDAGPLAPEGWQTYRAPVWSVDYPSDWTFYERESDGAIGFAPRDAAEKTTYFIVLEYDMTYTAALRASEDDAYKSTSVRIANYDATKFELGTGRHEYVIDYQDRVVVLATDEPENDTVGIMLASFGFTR